MRALPLFPALLAWCLWASLAWADARLSVLVDVLKLGEATQILSLEGQAYAQELNEEMLDGEGGPGWQQQVAAIYDPGRMSETVRSALGTLNPEEREAIIAFYSTALGQRIITLENSARQAMSEPDVEEAARARFAALEGSDDPRLAQIARYIASGDMITRNVTSAMNSNLFFLRGLVDGDAMEMSEQDMLADVQGDMEESREDAEAWLFGYLLMAYHPLTEDEMALYLDFSESGAGLALNRALFEGFGVAYEDISYALGRAVALNMTAQEL